MLGIPVLCDSVPVNNILWFCSSTQTVSLKFCFLWTFLWPWNFIFGPQWACKHGSLWVLECGMLHTNYPSLYFIPNRNMPSGTRYICFILHLYWLTHTPTWHIHGVHSVCSWHSYASVNAYSLTGMVHDDESVFVWSQKAQSSMSCASLGTCTSWHTHLHGTYM